MDLLAWFQEKFRIESGTKQTSFTPRALHVLDQAVQIAARQNRKDPTVSDLAVALFEYNHGVVANVLRRLGLDIADLKRHAAEMNVPDSIQVLVPLAVEEQRQLGYNYVGTELLLLALVRHEKTPVTELLREKKIGIELARRAVLTELDPRFGEGGPGSAPTVPVS